MNHSARVAALVAALGLAAAFTLPATAPALADETTGTLVAHDRKARRIVMNDKTIYEYAEDTERPATLTAGMRIKIDFVGGEDGIEAITAIEIVE